MAGAKKVDPYDVEALERSLNDSATRVSTIWVSFLIFSLYLLVAATTVEHRQLFLAEPVKLPILNIDLPLWGFFFLAPILFVIFHVYVLLQVLLLGRTAAAYNEAVDGAVKPPQFNAAIRQRLANTLFAQIFAGSPRERDGWLGWLLKGMAWITLAIAPVLILLAFEFAFLPYHSHLATWTHRALIFVELAAAVLLWPLVLDAGRDFDWRGLRQGLFLPISCALLVLLSLLLGTFPGEPHVNLLTGHSYSSVQCQRWFSEKFDRLHLPGVDVVDDEKLAKIAQATAERKLPSNQGERTRNFRNREFNCSDLSSADLRRVDLTGARLSGANLSSAVIEGGTLDGAHLQEASLDRTQLQGASLDSAQLQEASLDHAQLQGASLDSADLKGASLVRARFQGASLYSADLRGAFLSNANLRGAYLDRADFRGASLYGAELQGANLTGADLSGASLVYARLQGADLSRANMALSDLWEVSVWRARHAACHDARVINNKVGAMFHVRSLRYGFAQSKPEAIKNFIEHSTEEIPDQGISDAASARMRDGLVISQVKDDTKEIAQVWHNCKEAATRERYEIEFDNKLVLFLRGLACDTRGERQNIASGMVRILNHSMYFSGSPNPTQFLAQMARALLGEDGRVCAATKDLNESVKRSLREIAKLYP